MRIMPYRTPNNMIEGVVVTFPDITYMKQLEVSLRENEVIKEIRGCAENIVNAVQEPLLMLDADLRVISANQSFYQAFQAEPEETKKQLLYDLGSRQWDVPELRRLLKEVLLKDKQVNNYKVERTFPIIGHRVMRLNARRIVRKDIGTQMILLAIEDITKCNKKH
ncbi:MAG: PAS domain-containing protein [Planctomycetota bacterium]